VKFIICQIIPKTQIFSFDLNAKIICVFNLIKKFTKKYSEFALKIFTFIGLSVIYLFGISIGFIIFKILKNNHPNINWHKFNQNFNSKDMF